MSISKTRMLPALLALAMAISGCASFKTTKQEIKTAERDAKAAMAQLDDKRQSGAVVRFSQAKLSGQVLNLSQMENDLPASFQQPFNYLSVGERLSSILSEISRRTGMSVTIQPSLKLALDKKEGKNREGLEWRGSLNGLLDYIASSRDIFWRYDGGNVHFYQTETRSFPVFLPIGKRSQSSSIELAGVGGGESGGGGGEVSVSSTAAVDAYESLVKAVELIVAEGNPEVKGTVLASHGMLTVTSSPDVLRQVERYVRSTNERFAQNVLINVRVLNLSLDRDVAAGFSSEIVYNSLKRQLGASLTMPEILQPVSSSPGQLIINKTLGGGSHTTTAGAVIEALEQVGKVSIVTSGQILAANGQPSPFQAANDVTYISGTTTSQAANVGQTTTVETSTLTVGFTANFLPMILGDNRIMLQYQINLSTLLGLDQVGPAGGIIQIPNIAKQVLHQQAYIRDGESIVLFGYEQTRSAQKQRRGFMGASESADGDRTMLVIILEVFGGK